MDQQPCQVGSSKSKQGQEYQGVSFHSDLIFLTKINLQIWGEGWGGIRRRKSLFFCFLKKYLGYRCLHISYYLQAALWSSPTKMKLSNPWADLFQMEAQVCEMLNVPLWPFSLHSPLGPNIRPTTTWPCYILHLNLTSFHQRPDQCLSFIEGYFYLLFF